jgi:hypothetical protein
MMVAVVLNIGRVVTRITRSLSLRRKGQSQERHREDKSPKSGGPKSGGHGVLPSCYQQAQIFYKASGGIGVLKM